MCCACIGIFKILRYWRLCSTFRPSLKLPRVYTRDVSELNNWKRNATASIYQQSEDVIRLVWIGPAARVGISGATVEIKRGAQRWVGMSVPMRKVIRNEWKRGLTFRIRANKIRARQGREGKWGTGMGKEGQGKGNGAMGSIWLHTTNSVPPIL